MVLSLFLLFSHLSEYFYATCESKGFSTTFNSKFNYTIDLQSLRESISHIEYLVRNNILNSEKYTHHKKSVTISPIKAYIKMNF
jgi:hypothetical protein